MSHMDDEDRPIVLPAEDDDDEAVDISGIERCGLITLLGQPNVGKSTLMNALLGEKLAIVSPKPQTTRDAIRGILTTPRAQMVFIDTPGVHQASSPLNRAMVGVAMEAMETVDLVVHVIDARRFADALTRRGRPTSPPPAPPPRAPDPDTPALPPLDGRLAKGDRRIIHEVRKHRRRYMLALNKIDLVKKPHLLPIMEALGSAVDTEAIVPISAENGDGLDRLVAAIEALMPPGAPLYPPDDLTDRSLRFLTAELIREQVFLQIQQEVPYGVAVEIEVFDESQDIIHIQAVVHVERPSQRGILVGRGGSRMKEIATLARREIKAMLGRPVYLETLVRVEPKWSERLAMLRRFGYGRR